MIVLKSPEEVERMARVCRVVAETINALRDVVRPGITTKDIERFVDEMLERHGAASAFRGYRGYPSSVCTSVNDQVVHGIPSKLSLCDGDIISIDFGACMDGYYGDAAASFAVGSVNAEAARLLKVTEDALYIGIDHARCGNRVSDISHAIQSHVEGNGFSVVRKFVGHGIGRALHEDPQVPNFGAAGLGPRLMEGMTLAIEPMVNAGNYEVNILDDGWTAVTADGNLSAHFEHTVAITRSGPEILTKL